jgi:hypothetical protein
VILPSHHVEVFAKTSFYDSAFIGVPPKDRTQAEFSLDAKAFVDSIAIAPRSWHTTGDAWCCSSGSDAAHCYFGSRLSFSRFCALAHAANAP